MSARRVAMLVVAMVAFGGPAWGQAAKSENKLEKPAAKAPVEHTYAPAGKRDPFKDLEVTLPPPIGQSCGTLCDYDLDQFRVAALVTGISMPLAGLEAPNGKVYIVDKGTQIGKRGGRVAEVGGGKIVVEEPCAKDTVKKCRTTLGAPEAAAPKDEDLTRKK